MSGGDVVVHAMLRVVSAPASPNRSPTAWNSARLHSMGPRSTFVPGCDSEIHEVSPSAIARVWSRNGTPAFRMSSIQAFASVSWLRIHQ